MTSPSTFTPDDLAAMCRRAFPTYTVQAVRDVHPISSRQHEMVAFEMEAAALDQPPVHLPLVLRHYLSPLSWWRPDDRGKAQREATICRWLGAEGFPVPEVYLREFGPHGDVVLFGWLPGEELPVGGRPLQQAVQPVISAFAELLADLHRLTPPEAVQRVVPRVSVPGALANLAAMAATVGVPELTGAVEQAMALAYDVPELGPVLLHGDYHLLNARLSGNQIVGLLDWEYSALGDPRWDVANAYMQLVDFGAAEAADRFLSIYLDRTGWQFEGPPLYNAVVPLQQWAVSEWLVQRRSEDDISFALAQELIDQRDAHRRRAEAALHWLDV